MKIKKSLEEEVTYLINQRCEGVYWDFKRIIKFDKDLLHDILALSNCKHNGNRYLIIGVEDPKNLKNKNDSMIIGLTDEQLSKIESNNFYNWFQTFDFANQRPKIDYQQIEINTKKLIILVIHNSNQKPFYIINGKNEYSPLNNKIYTRIGDTNTPINSYLSYNDIKEMWKEQFGLTGNVKEKFKTLLTDLSNWEFRDVDNNYFCLKDPRYTINIILDNRKFMEAFLVFYGDSDFHYATTKFVSDGTIIYSYDYVFCDEYRNQFPTPHFYPISELNGYSYGFYYYIKNTFEFLLLELCEKNNMIISRYNKSFPYIIFENDDELEKFIKYITSNDNILNELNIKNNDSNILPKRFKQRVNIDSLEKFKNLYYNTYINLKTSDLNE
ncbi:MAG: ATP-binding protein [Methanosphaera stadtmanae]|nr:ATP-binding protein [Methanosphaera stadtmanae]